MANTNTNTNTNANAKEAALKKVRDRKMEEKVEKIDQNLRFWSALARTDPAFTKPFKKAGGFAGTAIAPMYSVKRMTEAFGPAGKGWGFDVLEDKVIEIQGADPMALVKGRIWWRDEDGVNYSPTTFGSEKLIFRNKEGKASPDDEAFKKAATDCMTKCMSYLGMSADVHLGVHDDHKMVARLAEYASATEGQLNEARKRRREAEIAAALTGEMEESQDLPSEPMPDTQLIEEANELIQEAVQEAQADLSDAEVESMALAVEATEADPQEVCPAPILNRISSVGLDGIDKAEAWVKTVPTLTEGQRKVALNAVAVRRKQLQG